MRVKVHIAVSRQFGVGYLCPARAAGFTRAVGADGGLIWRWTHAILFDHTYYLLASRVSAEIWFFLWVEETCVLCSWTS